MQPETMAEASPTSLPGPEQHSSNDAGFRVDGLRFRVSGLGPVVWRLRLAAGGWDLEKRLPEWAVLGSSSTSLGQFSAILLDLADASKYTCCLAWLRVKPLAQGVEQI